MQRVGANDKLDTNVISELRATPRDQQGPRCTCEVVPVLCGLVALLAVLVQDLDEDLHGTDEDGGQGLDGIETAAEYFPVHLMSQLRRPVVHFSGHLQVVRRRM